MIQYFKKNLKNKIIFDLKKTKFLKVTTNFGIEFFSILLNLDAHCK